MLNWLNSQVNSNKNCRDLALIQIGFFGAFRRSELVSIEVKDLIWEPKGLVIKLTHSKRRWHISGLYLRVRALLVL